MNVYIVENAENSPGTIMAIFASEEDADNFSDLLESETGEYYEVTERTLYYGQPARLGFNK